MTRAACWTNAPLSRVVLINMRNELCEPDARVGADSTEERLTGRMHAAYMRVEVLSRMERRVAHRAHGCALRRYRAVRCVQVCIQLLHRPEEIAAIHAHLRRSTSVLRCDVAGDV
jgi:hypothetical protein